MAGIGDAIKKAKALGYSGKDMYVPRATAYPHLHIAKDHVTYSTSKSSHKPLIQGSSVLKNNLTTALETARENAKKSKNYADMVAVLETLT